MILLKNNTGAIFQKTIAQKQTNQNLFSIDYCRRCSLASSPVRCSDVGEVHDRWMQLWVFLELHYEYMDKVNGILTLNSMILKLSTDFPHHSLNYYYSNLPQLTYWTLCILPYIHLFLLQILLQHSLGLWQRRPFCLHILCLHTPPMQFVPPQQSLFFLHLPPIGLQLTGSSGEAGSKWWGKSMLWPRSFFFILISFYLSNQRTYKCHTGYMIFYSFV